jgi:hypothetical protein
MDTLSPPLWLCPSKSFRHRNKNTPFLVMVYLALFNYIFKALYLFKIKIWQKSGCLAMVFGCFAYHSCSTQSSDTAVDSSLQLSIYAQTMGMASPLKLSSQCKTVSPPPFLKLIWAGWQSGKCSSLYASLLCPTAARVLYVSLTSEKTRKEGAWSRDQDLSRFS